MRSPRPPSYRRTITALRPAKRPRRRMTIRPFLSLRWEATRRKAAGPAVSGRRGQGNQEAALDSTAGRAAGLRRTRARAAPGPGVPEHRRLPRPSPSSRRAFPPARRGRSKGRPCLRKQALQPFPARRPRSRPPRADKPSAHASPHTRPDMVLVLVTLVKATNPVRAREARAPALTSPDVGARLCPRAAEPGPAIACGKRRSPPAAPATSPAPRGAHLGGRTGRAKPPPLASVRLRTSAPPSRPARPLAARFPAVETWRPSRSSGGQEAPDAPSAGQGGKLPSHARVASLTCAHRGSGPC